MNRWLPYPLLSAALAAMWLLLNGSLEAAHLLLAVALGWGGSLAFAGLQAPLGRVRRRAATVALLFWLILADIVRSNVAVARIVLNPTVRGRTAGFLSMPLELRHPGALAVLACIITATPGTSWARYDRENDVLTIHVLDLVDEQAWIEQFKHRYERRLLEIFQ
ncbi:MAG TPA: Na+/H+ antiporter subunit E [Burkholderiales bacterium]|nr:Na+/H+ antiporter subunit E [Burkholderiales bacterium]